MFRGFLWKYALFPTDRGTNSIWLGNMSLSTKVGVFSISLFSIWLWVNLHLSCLLCEDQILIRTHISGDYKNLQAFSCVWTAFNNRVLFDFYVLMFGPKSLSCCRLQGKVFSFQAHYLGHEIFDVYTIFPIISPQAVNCRDFKRTLEGADWWMSLLVFFCFFFLSLNWLIYNTSIDIFLWSACSGRY